MVMAYPVTEGETPPLPVQVFLAWHGIRQHLAHKKFSGDYRMAVNRLRDFATINLSGNERGGAMENLGAILLAHKNPDILERLTTPSIKGTAPFTAAELDMKAILWWGVQLAGNPRLFYTKKAGQPLLSVERIATSPLAKPFQKDGYVVLDGPALKLPELPTEDLKEMHGDSISALARMALICFAAGKITAAKWARQHGEIVEAVTYRHAVEHGQVHFLRQISVDSDEVKRTKGYDALRQLDLQLLTARDRKEHERSIEEGDVLNSFRLLSQAASDEQLKAIINELAARKGMVVVPVTAVQSTLIPGLETSVAEPRADELVEEKTSVNGDTSRAVPEAGALVAKGQVSECVSSEPLALSSDSKPQVTQRAADEVIPDQVVTSGSSDVSVPEQSGSGELVAGPEKPRKPKIILKLKLTPTVS